MYLPLTAQHKAKLLEHVPAGEETILTITDSVNTEYVRVKNQQGYITLERGVESGVYKFPKGSCVYFEVSVPVVEWLICNYECCKGDCPVQPPLAGGFTLPGGQGLVSTTWGMFRLQGRRADEHRRARTPRLGESQAVRSLAGHQRRPCPRAKSTLSRLRRPTPRVRSASSRER